MKCYSIKLIITVIFFLITTTVVGQIKSTVSLKEIGNADPKKQSENSIRTVNDLKTGNWQDVLASFFQLSISDITGDKKALNFKANLFALKVKADSNLLLSENYVKQKFARNFEFDFSLKMDTQYKFKGFQAGFTWALINRRDSTVVSYANTELDKYYSDAQRALLIAFNKFRNSLLVDKPLPDSGKFLPDSNLSIFNNVKEKTYSLLEKKYFVAKDEYPVEIQNFLDDSYINNFEKADKLFAEKLEQLKLKPLMTLSVNSTFENSKRAFNNGIVQLIYLQGVKTKRTKTEIDIRSSLNIKDTLVVTTDRRSEFNSSAGINFSLLQSKSNKSIIEFKPYFEYVSLLSKPYASEKREKFTANADLRVRIFENFWIPLTIKYDLDKGKFLGFLDVAFNFNAFKSQK